MLLVSFFKSTCDYIYGPLKYSKIMPISLFQDCLLKITCEKSFSFFSNVANIQRFQGSGLTFWVVIFHTPTVFPLTLKDSHLSHMQKPVTASQHPQTWSAQHINIQFKILSKYYEFKSPRPHYLNLLNKMRKKFWVWSILEQIFSPPVYL